VCPIVMVLAIAFVLIQQGVVPIGQPAPQVIPTPLHGCAGPGMPGGPPGECPDRVCPADGVWSGQVVHLLYARTRYATGAMPNGMPQGSGAPGNMPADRRSQNCRKPESRSATAKGKPEGRNCSQERQAGQEPETVAQKPKPKTLQMASVPPGGMPGGMPGGRGTGGPGGASATPAREADVNRSAAPTKVRPDPFRPIETLL